MVMEAWQLCHASFFDVTYLENLSAIANNYLQLLYIFHCRINVFMAQ